MHPKKSLGQNFLMHRRTAERIVAAARLPEDAAVLEVGPGTGMLTRALLSAGHRVTAVEADASLVPGLEESFAPEIADGRLTLIHADIRTFDLSLLPDPYHVVANIPYYITGELFRRFLTAERQPRSLTFLVQKEVAVRIARERKNSLLSLSIHAYGTPSYAFTVPRGAFVPAPSVDSAVLHIDAVSRERFASPAHEAAFFAVLHAGFGHKRKRLKKNLEEIASADALTEAFVALGIGENARAEELSLDTWLALSKRMNASS